MKRGNGEGLKGGGCCFTAKGLEQRMAYIYVMAAIATLTGLTLTMKKRLLGALLIFLTTYFTSKAQTYASQYEICSDSLQRFTQSTFGKQFPDSLLSFYMELVKTKDSCLLGVSAPNFQATTLDNKKIESASLKGQVIVLNFWFTACPSCLTEMPGFNKLVDYYAGKKVTCISVTYDSAAEVKKFLRQHPLKFITVADDDKIRMDDFKLNGIWPYTVIINKEGKIVFMQFGTKGEQTFSYFKAIIDKLL